MLSPKPWKLDAMVRLLLSLLICIIAGSLLASLVRRAGSGVKPGWALSLLSGGAFVFMGAALVLVRKEWGLGNFLRRLIALLVCFYAGFTLALCAERLAGPSAAVPSVAQTIIAALSLQGAGLFLVGLLLRDCKLSWKEGFGLAEKLPYALMLGLMTACIFTPLGYLLKGGCAWVLIHAPLWLQEFGAWLAEHLPHSLQWIAHWVAGHLQHLSLEPQEQLPVQTLQVANSWWDMLGLGLIYILVAPLAEEVLFRGLLYPWIKQAGFPKLALWGTSLLFAAIHANAVSFVPLFVLAIILTVLYEATNNLLAPAAAHSVFNTLGFVGSYLSERAFIALLLALAASVLCLFLFSEWRRTAPEHE